MQHLLDGKEQDIIFLDIEMGGSGAGLDGIRPARRIWITFRRKAYEPANV